jgi:hypothetical protein
MRKSGKRSLRAEAVVSGLLIQSMACMMGTVFGARQPLRMQAWSCSEFVSGQRRNIGHARENSIQRLQVATLGAGIDVVAHLPGADVRGEGDGHDVVKRGLLLGGGFGGQPGQLLGRPHHRLVLLVVAEENAVGDSRDVHGSS